MRSTFLLFPPAKSCYVFMSISWANVWRKFGWFCFYSFHGQCCPSGIPVLWLSSSYKLEAVSNVPDNMLSCSSHTPGVYAWLVGQGMCVEEADEDRSIHRISCSCSLGREENSSFLRLFFFKIWFIYLRESMNTNWGEGQRKREKPTPHWAERPLGLHPRTWRSWPVLNADT